MYKVHGEHDEKPWVLRDRIGEDEKVKTVTKNRNSQVDKMCSSRSSFIVVDHAVFFHQLFYYKVPFNTTRGCYREDHDWTQSSLIHLSCASSYLIVMVLSSRTTIEGELRNTYLPFASWWIYCFWVNCVALKLGVQD